MRYEGWHYERTLLIHSDLPWERRCELIDVRIAVRSERGRHIPKDVRIVLKKDWNIWDREIPHQVYAVSRHETVTTFRVVFQVDIPAHETVRVGVVYGNPAAEALHHESDLTVVGQGGESVHGFRIDNSFYHAETDPESGQLALLAIKTTRHDKRFNHNLTPDGCVQPGVSVTFALESEGGVGEETVSAAGWRNPSGSHTAGGPLFFSLTRRASLTPKAASGMDAFPELTVTYKFFADQPYILVDSVLEFPCDTPVFSIREGEICVDTSMFSHYTFRPVSPNLPLTDVEEMGHVLIDSEYTQGLPEGLILGSFLPYDMPWHSFVNIHKGPKRKQYGMTGMLLDLSDSTPGDDTTLYRAATYLERGSGTTSWFRAPVYVATRNKPENIVTVPSGSVFRQREVVLFGPWDIEEWAPSVEETGKRLNSPPVVEQFPGLPGVELPAEEPEPLPYGNRGDAYLRVGVR